MEQPVLQDHMVLTEDALQELPPFVASVVRDYCNGDEEQRFSLRDVEFDLESLNALPIREDTPRPCSLPLGRFHPQYATNEVALLAALASCFRCAGMGI